MNQKHDRKVHNLRANAIDSLLRRKLLSQLALLSALALGGAACGGRPPAPEMYDWDRSASALVAARGSAGGMVPQVVRFLENDTGSRFMRLYGDGTLYYGDPQDVSVRTLDEAAMQSLFSRVRPDLFGGYANHYNAGNATDMPTTTLRVAVKTWGSHEVGIYGLGSNDSEAKKTVPAELFAALSALADTRQGGKKLAPTRLRLAAEKIDLQQYTKIDATKIVDWPVANVDLAQADIYQTPSLLVENATDVAAILEAVPETAAEQWFPTQDTVFAHNGETYQVAWAVMLP